MRRVATALLAGLLLSGCATGSGRWRTVERTAVEWHGAANDNESNTNWTLRPRYREASDGTRKAIDLHSFEGTEEPNVRWVVARNGVEPDTFVNIVDRGGGTVRMTLRYRAAAAKGGWWDGDQRTSRFDRQRAEVKGIGPRQQAGDTYEYGTTFRTDPDFAAHERFCHIMQIKATDGDKAPPLVTVSLRPGGIGVLQYFTSAGGFKTAATFRWRAGVWQTVRFRLTASAHAGALSLSVNGAPFKGVANVAMARPRASEYRPKWGLYRGTVPTLSDDWIEHRAMIVRPVPRRSAYEGSADIEDARVL